MLGQALPGIILGIAVGFAVGIGGYTFIYAKGYSYLTNDPAACANCHIMSEHYARWLKSSHRSVAVCNDCHTPSGLIPKYSSKASNGFWHSFAFTTGWAMEPLKIKPHNLEIAENACRKCHREIVAAIEGHENANRTECIRCHKSVGHLE